MTVLGTCAGPLGATRRPWWSQTHVQHIDLQHSPAHTPDTHGLVTIVILNYITLGCAGTRRVSHLALPPLVRDIACFRISFLILYLLCIQRFKTVPL